MAPLDDTARPSACRHAYDGASVTASHRLSARLATWLDRWSSILPLLIAEFVVWLGFGALLPVMPLYFSEHGVDFGMLGVIFAAWPAARLVGEPIFGWLADRVPRVPLMVLGNVGAGVFQFLPLVIVGPVPFIILRALAGLSTAIYDPSARGYITDSTPPERRGEAFGLYGAAQMGGLLFGPAIGGLGVVLFGSVAFIFVFGAISSFIAAAAIALRVHETPRPSHERVPRSVDVTEFPSDPSFMYERSGEAAPVASGPAPGPTRFRNRLLIAAILINLGVNFAAGTYEVVWSLFLTSLGAGVGLIGLTFAMFGLPVLLLSPSFGRRADRGGVLPFILVGGAAPALAGIAYTLIRDPFLAVPLIMVEAVAFAMLNPVLFAVVAAGSPPGRSSTAQGVYGAVGTVGFVIASLVAGVLAEADIRYPFYLFSGVMTLAVIFGLIVGGPALRRVGRPSGQATPV